MMVQYMKVPFVLALALATGCGNGNGADADAASGQETDPAEQQQQVQNDTADVLDIGHLGHDMGNAEAAAVHVIEFSDFGCVHCQGFHQETFPALHEEFVEPGHVAWKYIPVSVGGFPNVEEVTEVAECAALQDAFFELKGRIYEDPDTWTAADEPQAVLFQWAEEEGLDVDELRSCAEAGETQGRVQEQTATAVELGLQATPTFVVNGQPVQGAPTLEAFRDFFRQELGEEPAPPDG